MRRTPALPRFAVAMALLPGHALAPGQLAPELDRLLRVQRRMASELKRLSNYACLETVQRTRRPKPGAKPTYLDNVYVEVAHIGGRELYSWPGAESFEERDFADIVGAGLVSSGTFSTEAQNLFVNKVASTRHAAEESMAGRRVYRFDFHIPVLSSGYEITTATGRAVVASAGSFWGDAESFDVLRIESRAEEIPPELGLRSAVTRIDYARVRLGNDSLLMPQQAVTTLTHFDGHVSENAIGYTHCRAYAAETRLTDVTTLLPTTTHPHPAAPSVLPAGLKLALELVTGLDFRDARVGDRITAKLVAPVTQQGRTLFPDGALVLGRLRRLERLSEPSLQVALGLEFNEIEAEGRRARFFGYLEGYQAMPGWNREPPPLTPGQAAVMGKSMQSAVHQMISFTSYELPGVAVFFIQGDRARVAQGWRMTWRTMSLEPKPGR